MLFVDTGAWYALTVPSEPDHAAATHFLQPNSTPLVTSDYFVDELLTLFVVRGHKSRGIDWLRDVLAIGGATLIQIDVADFNAACELYERFTDKAWSFTDCTNYVLMQRLSIATAFTFDQHYSQFGFCTVVP